MIECIWGSQNPYFEVAKDGRRTRIGGLRSRLSGLASATYVVAKNVVRSD